jgi:hypothetical protein
VYNPPSLVVVDCCDVGIIIGASLAIAAVHDTNSAAAIFIILTLCPRALRRFTALSAAFSVT